jgi:hypothetical protein
VRALMLALQAIVAADGPAPSAVMARTRIRERQQHQALVARRRRVRPHPVHHRDAHRSRIPAPLVARVPRRCSPREPVATGPRQTLGFGVSDSRSEMGAAKLRQMPSGAASRFRPLPLTCADVSGQDGRTDARLVRDEEAAGSNPATPTGKDAGHKPVL